MEVVGNLFFPKSLPEGAKNPAIVVGHPMGAVKEQSANLYAQKLADQGFVTLSLDLPFWGESEGQPRNAVLPDVYKTVFNQHPLHASISRQIRRMFSPVVVQIILILGRRALC